MLFGEHCPKCLYTLIINYGGYIKIPVERLWRGEKKELWGDHTPGKGLGKGRLSSKNLCVLTMVMLRWLLSCWKEELCLWPVRAELLPESRTGEADGVDRAGVPTNTTPVFLEDLGLISQNHTLTVIDFVRKMGLELATQKLCSSVAGEPTKQLLPCYKYWSLQLPSGLGIPVTPSFALYPKALASSCYCSQPLLIEITLCQLKNRTQGLSSSSVDVLSFSTQEGSRSSAVSSSVLAVSQTASQSGEDGSRNHLTSCHFFPWVKALVRAWSFV